VFCWIYLGVTGQEERGAGWWVGVGGTGVSLNWRYNHKPCDHDPFPPPKKPLNPAKAQQSQGIEIACYKLSQKPLLSELKRNTVNSVQILQHGLECCWQESVH